VWDTKPQRLFDQTLFLVRLGCALRKKGLARETKSGQTAYLFFICGGGN